MVQIRGTAGAIIKQLLIGPERSERPEPIACDGSGNTIDPTTGVVPVLKELERGKLSAKGTAFYITRYGVFMTAAHVLNYLIVSCLRGSVSHANRTEFPALCKRYFEVDEVQLFNQAFLLTRR